MLIFLNFNKTRWLELDAVASSSVYLHPWPWPLTSKHNQFIFVPRCTTDITAWWKSVNSYHRYHRNITDGWTDAHMHRHAHTDERHKNIISPPLPNGGRVITNKNLVACSQMLCGNMYTLHVSSLLVMCSVSINANIYATCKLIYFSF